MSKNPWRSGITDSDVVGCIICGAAVQSAWHLDMMRIHQEWHEQQGQTREGDDDE